MLSLVWLVVSSNPYAVENITTSLLSCYTGVECDQKSVTVSLEEVMNSKSPLCFFLSHRLQSSSMLCACVIPLSHSFDGFCKAHGNRLGHPQIYMMRVTESKKYKAVAFFFLVVSMP